MILLSLNILCSGFDGPCLVLIDFKLKFLVLDHLSPDEISPSGVVSITPNEDLKIPRWADCIQTMNLLNMKIKVWIYAAPFKKKTKNLIGPRVCSQHFI